MFSLKQIKWKHDMKPELFTCVEMRPVSTPKKKSLKLTTVIKVVLAVVSVLTIWELVK